MKVIKEILLPSFLPGLILLFLYYVRYLHADVFLCSALLLVSVANAIIGVVIPEMHKKAHTGLASSTEVVEVQTYRKFLHSLAGMAEIYFYTFLFLFGELTILAGWLVIKTIGSYRIYSDERLKLLASTLSAPSENLAQKEGASVSIFRLGNLMSILVGFVAAILLEHSEIVHTSAYLFILQMFSSAK